MFGLGALLDAPEPERGPDEVAAVLAWNWCEGWRPERLPIFCAIYDVSDPEALIERLSAMRAGFNEQDRKT